MSNILCIETSAALCSAALTTGDNHFYFEESKPFAHAEVLTGLIQQCLEKSGIRATELHAVAISEGPGSYTGLRIGTSTAKGLCYALNIPLIALDSLSITAAAAREKYPAYDFYWAMTDARRMEVYHAVYDPSLQPVTTRINGIVTDTDFKPDMVTGHTILCGDGAAKATAFLKLKDAEVVANAAAMCHLAQEAFTAKLFADTAYFEPFYLKQANITVSKS